MQTDYIKNVEGTLFRPILFPFSLRYFVEIRYFICVFACENVRMPKLQNSFSNGSQIIFVSECNNDNSENEKKLF